MVCTFMKSLSRMDMNGNAEAVRLYRYSVGRPVPLLLSRGFQALTRVFTGGRVPMMELSIALASPWT